jgi:hypothetical protein
MINILGAILTKNHYIFEGGYKLKSALRLYFGLDTSSSIRFWCPFYRRKIKSSRNKLVGYTFIEILFEKLFHLCILQLGCIRYRKL